MKSTRTLAVVLCGATLSWAALAQSSNPMRPGNWEITMQMDMAGAPAQMPAMKVTQCITPEQVAKPEASLPTGPPGPGGQNSDCKVSDFKIDGNHVTWKMACPSQKMNGTGDITYKGDAYDGVVKMTMPGMGEMSMKLAAKRLGECTK